MSIFYALSAVIFLILVAMGGGWLGWQTLFGIIIPYIAIIALLAGFVFRILKWARSPVPFHIPTVAGQEKSLPWIKNSYLESPSSTGGVIGRLLLEVLLFRSLFRNDRVELKRSERLIYSNKRYLWLGGLAFHWSLLVILLRHLRFFTQPVLFPIILLQNIDGMFQLAVPTAFISDLIILAALTYLILRRLFSPQVRYISLPADYFATLLISAVAISGILMRLFFRVDVLSVKELAMSLISFHPAIPEGLGMLFYVHIFLVSTLVAYFPFSKLMHGPGVLLSPTRNLQNNSRRQRHVNPWDYPVKVHTYAEWEDEFRPAMKKVGLPLEKE